MNDDNGRRSSGYLKFFAMIATSMVTMYALTYTNSFKIFDHAWFSETRLFMTMMMGGAMMAIMLSFMLGMYANTRINAVIYILSAVLIVGGLLLVRTQVTVDDRDYMEGMIPHHSIAILTSERARIEDPRVRKLADQIIEAQRREIKEMEWLISDIGKNGIATDADASERPVPEFSADSE